MFHVNELNTSYIKLLELLELDLPNKTYGNLWLIELDHNQAICMDVNL